MDIFSKYKKVTEKEITEIEKRIGYLLPKEYKLFMLKNNGGKPKLNLFNFKDNLGDTNSSIQYFFPIGEEYNENLYKEYSFYLSEGRIQKEYFPIAIDPFGNLICLNLSKENYGQIYFWDHELEESNNLFMVANDFNEFINILYISEPVENLIKKISKTMNLEDVKKLLPYDFNFNTIDENGRNMMENAAIHANNELISFLFEKGVPLRNSLEYAIKNAQFFEKHKKTVDLIKNLEKVRKNK